MAKVTIYRFKAWDSVNDVVKTSTRWATREAAEQIAHGEIIEESALEVDESAVQSDIFGFTVKGFRPSDLDDEGPSCKPGEFQTRVRNNLPRR
jgi:hypothetical protein